MSNTWNKKVCKMTIDDETVLDIKTVRKLMRRHKMSINTIFYQREHNGKKQTSFLYHAIQKENVKLLNWLVSRKVNPNIPIRNIWGFPLIYAVTYADLATVRKLVRVGAHINCREPGSGYTPLYWSRYAQDESVRKFLVENGADVNMEVAKSGHRRGSSPLQIFAEEEDIEVMKLLISKGANVNHKAANGYTPLISAVKNENLEIVNMLLDCGAEIDCRSADGDTPLHFAAYNGNFETIKLLLDRGADINCKSNKGFTPLSVAAKRGDPKIIKLLLDYGAGINCSLNVDDDIVTLLHYSLCSNQVETVEFFFNLYEIVFPTTILTEKRKDSLLHFAFTSGLIESTQVLDFLLNVGIDVNLENCDKMLAIEYSTRKPRTEAHLIMRKHMVKLRSANLPVCQRNQQEIGERLEDFAADCHEEVNRMKDTAIGDVHTTFYDVMHLSEWKLVFKVKFLQSEFQNQEKLHEMFPIYGGMLFYKLSKALKRMEQREKAKEILGEVFMSCYMPYILFRELFKYLIELDLRKIIGEKIPNLDQNLEC